MESKIKRFFISKNMEWEDLGGGISRQIMGYDKSIMMVKVKFEKGVIGSPHTHVHSQTSCVQEGKFEFAVEGKKQILEKGDSIYFEPDVQHSAVCLKKGIIFDIFSPYREDFLMGEKKSYFGNNKNTQA